MNNEKTIYDEEKTQYQSHEQEKNENSVVTETSVDTKRVPVRKPLWQRAAVGAGAGFAAGVAATVLTSGITKAQAQEQEEQEGVDEEVADEFVTTAIPEWTDGEVMVANSVNDDMSFNQAFAAARAEVGPGGVFEWRGSVYGTYYEDEWNDMSAAERTEYSSHFNWNEYHNNYAANDHQATSANTDNEEVAATVVDTNDEDGVQVLGVVYDEETDTTIGGMLVDGHEAVVLDVDGDMTFDILGVDINDNHEIEENESMDISHIGVTVDDITEMAETDTELSSFDASAEIAADVY